MADEGAVTTPILCSGPAVPLRGEERHYFYNAKYRAGVRASPNQPGCFVDPIYFMIKSRGSTHLLTEMDVLV